MYSFFVGACSSEARPVKFEVKISSGSRLKFGNSFPTRIEDGNSDGTRLDALDSLDQVPLLQRPDDLHQDGLRQIGLCLDTPNPYSCDSECIQSDVSASG